MTAIFCRLGSLEVKAIERFRSSAPIAGWFASGYGRGRSVVHCDPTLALARTSTDARVGIRSGRRDVGASLTPEEAAGA